MAECDVFISYKREERERVQHLAEKLGGIGLKVWFDTRLRGGDSFDEQIAAHLKVAKIVLVCWTPGAIESTWVRSEASLANNAKKLLAVFLAPTELIPPFNLVQTEDLSDWAGEDDHSGWTRLLINIASRSGDPLLADWAKMMNEGTAGDLRRWTASQPAGPLRAATRYRLSELGGGSAGAARAQPVAKGGVLLSRGFLGALLILIMGMFVAVSGMLYFQNQELRSVAGAGTTRFEAEKKNVTEGQKTIATLRDENLKLSKQVDDYKTNYGRIEALEKTAAKLRDQIDDVLTRRPAAVMQENLKLPPAWGSSAIREMNAYIAKLQTEFDRIDRAPASPVLKPN